MQTIIHNYKQFLNLNLENTESSSKVLRVNALIDTGCNVDLCISSRLAAQLGLKVQPLKNAISKYASGKSEPAKVASLIVGFLTIDHEFSDFEAVAFVTDKENADEVEIGNKLLSKFCVANKLKMEFDYYENTVKFVRYRRKA